VKYSSLTKSETVPFAIYWMGFAVANPNITKIGTQIETLNMKTTTAKFNVSVPTATKTTMGMATIDAIDLWISFFDIKTSPFLNPSSPIYQFRDAFRASNFNDAVF